MWLTRSWTSLLILLFIALQSVCCTQTSLVLFSNMTHVNKIIPKNLITNPIISNLAKVIALDIDVTAGHVYWTDVKEKIIKRANIDGSDVRNIITTGIGVCDGIAVEWISRKIYWTDDTYNVIVSADLDGSKRNNVISKGLDKPRGIAVYPKANLMYWTDWGAKPKIERSSLTGTSRTELITNEIMRPAEITIDYSSNRIYWVDEGRNWIQSADLHGRSRNTVYSEGYSPFGLSILNNKLYWTDLQGIHVTDIRTTQKEQSIYQSVHDLYGVTVYDTSRQPQGSRFSRSSHQSFVLFSNTTQIVTLPPNTSTPVPLIYNLVKAIALDVDVAAGHVYWTDVAEKSIKRANIDGSDVRNIITTGIGVCDGIAVEWISRKIYWVDSTYHFIQVAEMDGSNRKILIDKGLDKPRGIAVYPQADLIFWTDWGVKPKIERSSLTGTSRTALITDNITTPGEITIDYSTNLIYWVDSHHDWLQCADLDGQFRQTLFQQKGLQPFGISVLDNQLYWTDWVSRGIHVFNLQTSKLEQSLQQVGTHPMGVAIYDTSRQPQVSKSFMLISDDGAPAVYKVNVDVPNHNRAIFSVNKTSAITYDPVDERIYWIDGQKRGIRRVFLNMTGEEPFNAHSVEPETLAVDWLGRHLYWTDTWTRRIEAARLDNGLQTSVIISGLERPHGLVLHPPKGLMYWTDWGTNPKIEVANMDGTSRWTLVDTDLKWPMALTLDITTGRIYWVDDGKDMIQSRDILGVEKKRKEYEGIGIQPFSLAFFKRYVFWIDTKTRSVQQLDVKTGVTMPYVKSLSKPNSVFIYDPASYPKESTMCSNGITGCSHVCLIRRLGYTCACPSGYKLKSDRKTCERAQTFVLFIDDGAPSVNILPLDVDVAMWTPVSILPNNSKPSDFDYDPISDSFFWTDTVTGTVNSYNMKTKVFRSLHRCNVQRPMGIAVDWVGGNIYWTDAQKGTVEVSRTDGSKRRVLFRTPNVTSIVLDLKDGRMFVSVCGPSPQIIKLFMDGSSNITLVDKGLKCPTSLTFDQKSHRVYWIDVIKKKVESVIANNANREVLYLDSNASPSGFTLHGDYAYITDGEMGRVYRIGLEKKSNITLATALNKPTTIRYFDKQKLLNVSQRCAVNNGGCSDLCLLSASRGIKCACSTGGKLLKDGKSCDHAPFLKKMDTKVLLIADMYYHDIFKIPLGTKESICTSIFDSNGSILGGENNKRKPFSMTYNPSDEMLYWTDINKKAVMRGTKDGRNIEVVAQMGILYPDGIDVDYISGNVYWTDWRRNRIEVSKLDGSDRKVLIGWSLEHPGSIVVDPIAGHMYWIENGTSLTNPPKIEKAHMDGTNRKTLIGTDLKRPTGLAIDFRLRRLYWADELTGKIESVLLDGSNRRTSFVIPKRANKTAQSPFGLAFNGGKLYWADILTRSVYQLEVATGELDVVANGLSRPVDVRVVSNMDVDIDTNECSKRNGGCSNLCLPVPAIPGFKCACPEGVKLKIGDDKTCEGVNRCPEISGLQHGRVDEHCHNIPGGVCNITCDVGYRLNGEKIMYCHRNGTWTARIPKCEAITCWAPIKPKNSRFESEECNNETNKVRYGVTCKYVCTREGFEIEGPKTTTCQINGDWSLSSMPTSCEDKQAPDIGCPTSIVSVTNPGLPTALVNWTLPSTHDNADSNPKITVIPAGLKPPHPFKAGVHKIRYYSTDMAGLTGSCLFQVTVKDEEPPRVVQCKNNFTFITKQAISRVYFSGINFSDNVGVTKVDLGNVTRMAWGTHQITVRAYDAAGNKAECDINVMVYSERCQVDAPVNGYKECNTWRDGGVFCSISCKKGYAITAEPQKFYMCSHSERWRNAINFADGRSRLPDCSKIIGFTELSISGELRYDAEKCLKRTLHRSIKNKISQLLKKYFLSTLTICVDKGSCNLGDISLSCTSKPKRRFIRTVYSKEMRAKFKIHVYLSSPVQSDAINQTRNEMQSLINDGINISDVEMVIEGYALKFDTNDGLTVHEIRGVCGVGQVYREEQCVNCPIGHYHNITKDNCEKCAVDTYQENEGQQKCIPCKNGLSTLGIEGAWTIAQCRECEDFEKTEIKVDCEKWRRNGECKNNKPKMFDMCPLHCGFCAVPWAVKTTKARKRQGLNLKAVIPALVVPTVIVVSAALLVVFLLRRKRKRREDENKLSLDAMIRKKVALDKSNNDRYKGTMQVQQLHVRFLDDKNAKKKNRNKKKSSPFKAVLRKEKKCDDEEMYVKIPLKKTKVVMTDKKPRKKIEEKSKSSDDSEQVSSSLGLQEISAQMDATQV